jgi:hypothetical protein
VGSASNLKHKRQLWEIRINRRESGELVREHVGVKRSLVLCRLRVPAAVAELVYARASDARGGNPVEVRILSAALDLAADRGTIRC